MHEERPGLSLSIASVMIVGCKKLDEFARPPGGTPERVNRFYQLAKTKPGRVPIPLTQIENHLVDQLGFLERANQAFDEGHTAEYKRIALAIRILAYDSRQSHSLLGQLGMKDIFFISYADKIFPENLIASHPLVLIGMNSSGACFAPKLDGGQVPPKFLLFDDWWYEDVFRSPDGTVLTRRDFVLIVANQDGGAHVDPDLDERYSKLVNHDLANWVFTTPEGDRPILQIEKSNLRHIGFEFAQSVRDAWEKRLGNRLCTCGSGRKFRYCCRKSGNF